MQLEDIRVGTKVMIVKDGSPHRFKAATVLSTHDDYTGSNVHIRIVLEEGPNTGLVLGGLQPEHLDFE